MTPLSNPYSILLVDDTPNNLAVLSDFLGDVGFEILVARDGESALQKASYANPDLILLDVMMPGIDGFETCHRLQTDPATCEIPIIFMTALSESQDKVKGLSLGAVDYITKPFQQDEVLARVRLHLKLHSLKQQLTEQNQQLQREVDNRRAAEAALQQLNQDLEARVAARTQELSQALTELKQTQLHLIHGEKLAALGQLVTGVAHEIYNPINFIVGNLSHANAYVQDTLGLLKLYQQAFPEGTPEIRERSERLDISFIQEDLPKVLMSMKVGADRIQAIVRSLQIFSSGDEFEAKVVDLHTGLESTLMILNSRLKAKPDRPAIQVIKQYGELPPVNCYPGQLNQVFMNLLTYAIESLERGWQQQTLAQNPPHIRITTALEAEDQVTLAIADTGPGIPADELPQLFEPAVTASSPEGKIGLSISHKVVTEVHGGRLQCRSTPGVGTEFILHLPVTQRSLSPLS